MGPQRDQLREVAIERARAAGWPPPPAGKTFVKGHVRGKRTGDPTDSGLTVPKIISHGLNASHTYQLLKTKADQS